MKKGRGGRAGASHAGRVVVMRKPRGAYIPVGPRRTRAEERRYKRLFRAFFAKELGMDVIPTPKGSHRG